MRQRAAAACIFLFLLLLPCPAIRAAESAPADAGAVTVDEAEGMLGQLLMFGFRGTGPDDPRHGADFAAMRELIRAGKVGGVILFHTDVTTKRQGRNIVDPAQVARLTAALRSAAGSLPPPLVAVDQEGGQVRRLLPSAGFVPLPSAAEMGRMDNADVRALARRTGAELRRLGINVDLAPCVDVDIARGNPIAARGRSFGRDAKLVADRAGAFARGLHEAGVVPCLKHFPGKGSSVTDAHLEFTDVTGRWQERELIPYRAILGAAPFSSRPESLMVMTGHLFDARFDDRHPAGFSRKTTGGLLRGDLGWDGVIISDDLQMRAVSDRYSLEEAVFLSLDAGADILLFGNNLVYEPDLPERVWEIARSLLREGRVTPERIARSWRRVTRLKRWASR